MTAPQTTHTGPGTEAITHVDTGGRSRPRHDLIQRGTARRHPTGPARARARRSQPMKGTSMKKRMQALLASALATAVVLSGATVLTTAAQSTGDPDATIQIGSLYEPQNLDN